MKKSAVIFFLLALALRASAQLFGGSDAPDFTATDLTGKTWRLYDVLDEGKSVVLVFGMTHSTQTWAYYKSFSMQNFYKSSGPAGKNTAELFFVESDPKTNTACLLGPSGCNDNSLGNWVRDANQYPIFNDDHIPKIYSIKIFPTIIVICPNRKAHDIGIGNEDLLLEQTRDCPIAKGDYNIGLFNVQTGINNQEVCDGVRVAPSCTIVNLGRKPLNNVRADLLWNGQIVRVERSYGLLPRYGETRISFDTITVSGNGSLSIEVSMPDELDEFAADNRSIQRLLPAPNTLGNKLILRLRTDDVGSETYWELRDDQNKVVNFGGNRAVGPNGGGKSPNGAPRHASAYRSNTIVTDTLTLPRVGCYTLLFVDAFGDGMCCSNSIDGYYRLFDPLNLTQSAPLIAGGAFKAYDYRSFYWSGRSTSVLATDDDAYLSESLKLSPNPASDDLNLTVELPQPAPVSLRFFTATGRLVSEMPAVQRPAGAFNSTFDVANWPNGVYFCQINIGRTNIARKIIIAR